MPSSSIPCHSSPNAWFDTAEGQELLLDELGLLLPLLVRCTGSHICHIQPNATTAMRAPVTLMPQETRLWCDENGWHSDAVPVSPIPPLAGHSVDLVVAAHVIATLPDPEARIQAIYHMLTQGGTAFFIEFYPYSLFRRRWGSAGLRSLTIFRMRKLLKQQGFEIEASYALRPRSAKDFSGMLLRHNWRLPFWLPLRAYAIRVRKTGPGMTLAGKSVPNQFSVGSPAV